MREKNENKNFSQEEHNFPPAAITYFLFCTYNKFNPLLCEKYKEQQHQQKLNDFSCLVCFKTLPALHQSSNSRVEGSKSN
jgi:hypothetical protein